MKMDATTDIFQSRLYKINFTLLSLLGQWPFQKERDKRAMFTAVSIISMTQAVAQVLALVTLYGDFNAIVECIPPLMVDFVCVVKLMNLMFNMKKITMLFTHIQKDWQSWAIKREFEILNHFAENGRSITIGYAGGIYTFGGLVSLMAIVPKIISSDVASNYSTRPVGFPYHVEYYVDLEKYYYPALIHSYLASATRLTIIIASDTCLVILVQHCCGLFSIVRYRLEHIRISVEQDKKLLSLGEDEKFYSNFVYCIQKHEDALQFAKCLDNVYVEVLFVEVGIIILVMSFSALQASSEDLTLHLAIRHGGYISAQLLHLYIACWLGQQIIDHSDRVYTSTFNSKWYTSSSRSIKLLNVIMLRSITPCTLTIGKMMVLSLTTFSAVVRVSASYFTVMQSIH